MGGNQNARREPARTQGEPGTLFLHGQIIIVRCFRSYSGEIFQSRSEVEGQEEVDEGGSVVLLEEALLSALYRAGH